MDRAQVFYQVDGLSHQARTPYRRPAVPSAPARQTQAPVAPARPVFCSGSILSAAVANEPAPITMQPKQASTPPPQITQAPPAPETPEATPEPRAKQVTLTQHVQATPEELPAPAPPVRADTTQAAAMTLSFEPVKPLNTRWIPFGRLARRAKIATDAIFESETTWYTAVVMTILTVLGAASTKLADILTK